ncbi:MAG: hypothetical protein LBS75_09225 [Synergistaceae bacterium]|jgi:hypothetical protein|nr:hypothetical protein [Synergistaceae bacterium]
MMSLNEIMEAPESRRAMRMLALAAAIWIACFAVAVRITAVSRSLAAAVSASGRIVDSGMRYRAYPRTEQAQTARKVEDPLGALTQIVDALSLKDRMQQLQSNASGVLIQLERLYGQELREFLSTVESRGLQIRTAEIRALPSGGGRVLSATFTLEQSR